MPGAEWLKVFREKGALLEGHFGLTSGLHSPVYLQCALILQYPQLARSAGRELAEALGGLKVDAVVSPAVGGILVGQETAFFLGARAIFTERAEGKMVLRRGFSLSPGERVLVAEDVVTTGGSTREVADLVRGRGGEFVATASMVHRYTQLPHDPTDRPHFSLFQIHAPAFEPSQCPLCAKGIALDKPGSRDLKK